MAKKKPHVSSRTIAGQKAFEYCERFPSAPSRSLARKLLTDHPKLFTDVEHALHRVRYYRGAGGKKNRSRAKRVVKTTLQIPKSTAKTIRPHMLKARGRGLVLSDIHVPHHDEAALRLALEFAIGEGRTDFLILNGDIIDAYQLSYFTRDPQEREFAFELASIRELLESLAENFGQIIYKLGNHERRLETYLRAKAAELIGVDQFTWASLLGVDDLGITLIPDRQVIHAGELTILHGHEYGRGVFSPVNAARGMYLRAKSCTLSGHLHSTSQHNEADVRGRLISCWSTGCLCGLSPEYAPLNRWDHGFALLDFDGSWFQVETKRIVKGKIV